MTELLQAVREGNTDQLEACLRAGSSSVDGKDVYTQHDLDSMVMDGEPLLFKAASTICRSKPEIMRLLLQYGANANFRGRRGMTVLHACAVPPDPRRSSSNSSARRQDGRSDNDGGSTSKYEVLHVLLQQGRADPNVPDDHGWTPLHVASFFGHIEMGRILLQHGADTQLLDSQGFTVLDDSCLRGNAKFARMLLEHEKKNTNDRINDKNNNGTIAAAVVANPTNEKGKTLLHHTASRVDDSSAQVVEVLLEFGASPHRKDDRSGKLPLELACEKGSLSNIFLLLQRMLADGSVSLISRKKEQNSKDQAMSSSE